MKPTRQYATDKTFTAVAYIRVSTAEQSLGLDVQRERVAAYCSARGWSLVAVIEDNGRSGATLDRDGMHKVREVMRRKMVDAVISLKLDRLTRKVEDLHTLMQESADSGVALVSIMETLDTSSAAGRLMVHMLASMAEWERDVISERTSAALSVKSGRGERVGRHAAIGSANGEGARAVDEQRTLTTLRGLIMADCCGNANDSLRCLAEALEAEGCMNRAGNRYGASTIQRMMRALAATDEDVAERLNRARFSRRSLLQDARAAELTELLGNETKEVAA